MSDGAKRSVALVAPYAAWMALMVALPGTAWAYAVRGAVTAALLIAALPTLLRQAPNPVNPVPTPAANHEPRITNHEPRITNHDHSPFSWFLLWRRAP